MMTRREFRPMPPWDWILAGKNEGELIALRDSERQRHGICLGGTGQGKSKLIELILMGDVRRRLEGQSDAGWIFLDPHGETADDLISRLALVAEEYPQLRELVVVVDLTSYDWVVSINPISYTPGNDVVERIARRFADELVTTFATDALVAVRLYRILLYCAMTLALAGEPICNLKRLLMDGDYRLDILARVSHEEVEQFFFHEFPTDKRQVLERIDSTLSRIDRFLLDPDVKAFLCGKQTLNLREAMDAGLFIVFRAPRGKLSKDTSRLLLALFLNMIEAAALSREDIPKHQRRSCNVVVDEFVTCANDAMAGIIQECRKYKCFLLLFGQSVEQVRRNELLAEVLGSVDYLMCYRLGWADADVVFRDMFLYEIDQIREEKRRWRSIGGFPYIETDRVYRNQEEIAEMMRRQIMTLPPQTLFFRRKGELKTHRIRVLDVPDIEKHPLAHHIPKARSKLLAAVRARWGRDKTPPEECCDDDERGW